MPTPTNEFGIVVPPPITECLGEECVFRKDQTICEPNVHHLHSTEPVYEAAGEDAKRFRRLSALTVWMHACQHRLHHNHHEVDVPVPDKEIIHGATKEARKLGEIATGLREISWIENRLASPDIYSREVNGLNRRKNNLLLARHDLLDSLGELVILPEEIVTGILLQAAPDHARSRIKMGADFVLTGTLKRSEIPYAISFADEVLDEAVQAA